VSPFPVDPELLSRIRRMRPGDEEAVAALHFAAMGDSLWARLGVDFLRTLYSALIGSPEFLGYVYEEGGRIRGFIAGTTDGKRLMRSAMKRRGLAIAFAALKGAWLKPGLALRAMGTFGYFAKSRVPGLENVTAESMFCSFEPELRGKRISGLINKVLFDDLAFRGHHYVKITTEADNEGAIRQLTNWGFAQAGRFRFYGKEMIAWRLDLSASDRIEPVSRVREDA